MGIEPWWMAGSYNPVCLFQSVKMWPHCWFIDQLPFYSELFGLLLSMGNKCKFNLQSYSTSCRSPREQSSWGQHGAHLGPVGPRWAPFWPHEPYYQGRSLHYVALVNSFTILCFRVLHDTLFSSSKTFNKRYVYVLLAFCNMVFFRKFWRGHLSNTTFWTPTTASGDSCKSRHHITGCDTVCPMADNTLMEGTLFVAVI